jgi:hypothetical protein
VFAGPSGASLQERYAQECRFRAPIRRGDLDALVSEEPPGVVLILDGLFASQLAVTPAECRAALFRGWTLIGASSLGALRAAELWSVGMIGVGDIFNLLRLGILSADAELAVTYHPDTFEELTVSLVHVRAFLAGSKLPGVSDAALELAFAAAQGIYWAERSWASVVAAWASHGLPDVLLTEARLEARRPMHHPKRHDAELALQTLLGRTWVGRRHHWKELGN